MNENENTNPFSDLSENDIDILKHKESHFSGSFPLMIEYYQSNPDVEFRIERMQELEALERSTGQSLASFLSEEDQEEIVRAKEFYKKLRELYNQKKKPDSPEILIADLILAENPEKEIGKVVALGKKIVPFLIALLQNDDLKNPLFPGYGTAGQRAVECLRGIHDDSAIIALFEEIGHEEVVDEEGALLALKAIGEPAMKFLLKVASSEPVTFDNERAAIGLIHFKDTQEVAESALRLLEKDNFRKSVPLSSYLALIAGSVNQDTFRKRLLDLGEMKDTPGVLKTEIQMIARTWKGKK